MPPVQRSNIFLSCDSAGVWKAPLGAQTGEILWFRVLAFLAEIMGMLKQLVWHSQFRLLELLQFISQMKLRSQGNVSTQTEQEHAEEHWGFWKSNTNIMKLVIN